jgi:hypothetical protein
LPKADEEGAKLENEADVFDPYADEARAVLVRPKPKPEPDGGQLQL